MSRARQKRVATYSLRTFLRLHEKRYAGWDTGQATNVNWIDPGRVGGRVTRLLQAWCPSCREWTVLDPGQTCAWCRALLSDLSDNLQAHTPLEAALAAALARVKGDTP